MQAIAILKTFVSFVGAKVAVAMNIAASAQATMAIGSAVIAGSALVAKKAMSLFEVKMSVPDTDRSRQSTVKSASEPQKIIYGEALVSGPISFIGLGGVDNKDLYQTIVLAGHEVNAITDVYFDDFVINNNQINSGNTAGGAVNAGAFQTKNNVDIVTINKYRGTNPQTADSMFVGQFGNYTDNHRGDGIAYLAMKWVLNGESAKTWDKYAPGNVKALVQGKKVYDPRLEVTAGGDAGDSPGNASYIAYSDNPALCAIDYLMDQTVGLSVSSSKIDWLAVITAANGCDATVTVPGGTEKTFTCNGVVFATDTHQKNINKILSSMNGSLVYSNGKYVLRAGIYANPTVSLNEDDLIGSITVKTSIDRSERVNTIKGLFLDPSQGHKMVEFPKVQLSNELQRDNNIVMEKETSFSMTNTSYMAQRLAHKIIKSAGQQKVITFPANYTALNVTAGDRVQVSIEELSWVDKEFICVGWVFSEDGGVLLTLREDSSDAYSNPTSYSQVSGTGTITDASRGVPSPSGLQVESAESKIFLNWVNPTKPSDFNTIEVWASATNVRSNAVNIGETNGTQFTHDQSNSAITYAVGDTLYYWVRAKKNVGDATDTDAVSGYFPATTTSSANVTVTAAAVDWGNVANPTIGIDLDNDDTISINLGDDTATTSGQAVAQSGIEQDVEIAQGGITMNQGGSIKGGQSAYNSGTGFFLGYVDGTPTGKYKFSIGNSSTESLTFDGTNLAVTGDITASSGSFTGSVSVSNTGSMYGGTMSSFNTGAGFFLGYDTDAYKLSVGDASGEVLTWDGSKLNVEANTVSFATGGEQDYSSESRYTTSQKSATVVLANDSSYFLFDNRRQDLAFPDFIVSYYLGPLTSGTQSSQANARNGIMDGIQVELFYADASTGSPETWTSFRSITADSWYTDTGTNYVFSNFRVKDSGSYVASLDTRNGILDDYPTMSPFGDAIDGTSVPVGLVDNDYFINIPISRNTVVFPKGRYFIKVVITVTDGSLSPYPSTGSPTATERRVSIPNASSFVHPDFGQAVFVGGAHTTIFTDNNRDNETLIKGGSVYLMSKEGANADDFDSTAIFFGGRGTTGGTPNSAYGPLHGLYFFNDRDAIGSGSGILGSIGSPQFSIYVPYDGSKLTFGGDANFTDGLYINGVAVNAGAVTGPAGSDTQVQYNDGGSLGGSANFTFNDTTNTLTVQNLTVNGTTTTVDTDNLTVKDNNITLNYSTGDSSSTANNAGITIQDAVDASTDASILWKTASDSFEFSHPVKDLTASGTLSSGAITSTGLVTADRFLSGLGTAASPAFQVGDTNSGFYDSGANMVGVALNGVLEYDFQPTQLDLNGNNIIDAGTISSGAITSTSSITGKTGTFTGQNGIALEVNSGTTNVVANFESGDATVWINLKDSDSGTYGTLLGAEGGLFRLRTNNNDSTTDLTVDTSGNLSVSGTISSGAITSTSKVSAATNYSYGGLNYHFVLQEDTNDSYIGNVNGHTLISSGGYYYGAELRKLNPSHTSYSGLLLSQNGSLRFEQIIGGDAGDEETASVPFSIGTDAVSTITHINTGNVNASTIHGRNVGHVEQDYLFAITDWDTSESIRKKFNSTSTAFTKVDDSTAPASGVFQVVGTIQPQSIGELIPLGEEDEIIFECWAKYVSGGDSSGLFYAGSSFYNGSQVYLGNNQRYWGASANELDSTNGTAWRHIRGVLNVAELRLNSTVSTAEYARLLVLFNYTANANTTRYCGFKFYRSRKTVTSLYHTSNARGTKGFSSDWEGTQTKVIDGSGNLYTTEYLYHSGDTDTYLRFLTNQIIVKTGNADAIDIHSNGNMYVHRPVIQYDPTTWVTDTSLTLHKATNSNGIGILFSDHVPTDGGTKQTGSLTYYHADGFSYGSGNTFVFASNQSTLTVLADGKLMFNEGLYLKPASGTGAGTQIITSSGNLTNIGSISASGPITMGSGTAGFLALTDAYDVANNDHLANIGWLRSSGGTYIGYGVKQSGSATWKSTFDNASAERNYVAFDEDSVRMVYAPAQQTAVDSEVTGLTEKFKFNLQHGRLIVTSSGTIGGATPANGFLQLTDGSDTLAFDTNEIHSTDDLYILVEGGDITFRGTSNAGVDLINGGFRFMDAARNLENITSISTSSINLNNGDINNVNAITINDPGVSEGISWLAGNLWKIYESPDNLTNAAGNLQIVTNATRRATFYTDGSFEVTNNLQVNDRTVINNEHEVFGRLMSDQKGLRTEPVNNAQSYNAQSPVLFDTTTILSNRATTDLGMSNIVAVQNNYAYASTGPQAGGSVIRVSDYRQVYSDYIPVTPGETVYGEFWARRISGSGSVVYYGLERFDSQKRPIGGNTGTTYFVASGLNVTNTTWTRYSNHYRIPTSHTPFGSSDGGGVYYVRVRLLLNYNAAGATREYAGFQLRRVSLPSVAQSFGHAGPFPGNVPGTRFAAIEGNTDAGGEGSGRLFFSEHNSTSEAMDNYGLSLGYRGGSTSVTTSGGNTWTGLSQIGNGEWGMWGHNNNLTGALIMDGDRAATRINFNDNKLYLGNRDGTTYLQSNGDSLRVQTSNGSLDMGPANTSYCHFSTDRSRYYFNQKIVVDSGILASYNEDLKLYRADSSSYSMTLSTSGATFTHNVTAYSDRRLKEDIKPIENALNTVLKLQGVTYKRIDNNENNLGFIAQQIEEAAPEIADRVVGEMDDERKTKHVNYANMVALLTEAIKDQQEIIYKLTKRIEDIENGDN